LCAAAKTSDELSGSKKKRSLPEGRLRESSGEDAVETAQPFLLTGAIAAIAMAAFAIASNATSHF